MVATTWVSITNPTENHFSLQNLPYGIFSYGTYVPRVGVAIWDCVLDLSVLHTFGLLEDLGYSSHIFHSSELNAFMALDKSKWTATRQRLTELLEEGGTDDRLRESASLKEKALIPLQGIQVVGTPYVRINKR